MERSDSISASHQLNTLVLWDKDLLEDKNRMWNWGFTSCAQLFSMTRKKVFVCFTLFKSSLASTVWTSGVTWAKPLLFFFFFLGTAKLTLSCSWRRRLLIQIQVKKNNVKHFKEHQREGEVRCCMLKAWHRGLLVCWESTSTAQLCWA